MIKMNFIWTLIIASIFMSCNQEVIFKKIKEKTEQGNTCVDSALINHQMPIPKYYDPVCGCDGKTYGNAQEATYYGGVKKFTKGECKKDEVKDTSCIDENLIDTKVLIPTNYDPVCGCDGKTYSNVSAAKYYGGVKKYTKGECKKDEIKDTSCIDENLIDTKVFIPTNYDPVCGCDGKTYSNESAAKYYGGVKKYTKGVCKE